MTTLNIDTEKRAYFVSDHHFGAPNAKKSIIREQLFIQWLNDINKDAGVLFILGDLFDFWFEYKTVVPKGFVRVLGKLASMADDGLPIYFFVGNHDLWMKDYFKTELNITVFHKPQEFKINNKTLYLAHGDGLGKGDQSYKIMKKVFTNKLCKWLFKWLHPDIGVSLAQHLSVKNKLISGEEDVIFLGENKEDLIIHTKEQQLIKHRDVYMYGHRHLPMILPLKKHSTTYVNTGDWISYFTYVTLNSVGELSLNNYQSERK